jgi:hypothetical protein
MIFHNIIFFLKTNLGKIMVASNWRKERLYEIYKIALEEKPTNASDEAIFRTQIADRLDNIVKRAERRKSILTARSHNANYQENIYPSYVEDGILSDDEKIKQKFRDKVISARKSLARVEANSEIYGLMRKVSDKNLDRSVSL